MDNKTLALLGLGAALTAFLSHQSYKSGNPWFGSGSSIPAVTASSEDSGPEPVAAAPVAEAPAVSSESTVEDMAASVPSEEYEEWMGEVVPYQENCGLDPRLRQLFESEYWKVVKKKREQYYQKIYNASERAEAIAYKKFMKDVYKNLHLTELDFYENESFAEWLNAHSDLKFDTSEQSVKELYERLDRHFPRCAPKKPPDYCGEYSEPEGDCAERQKAINNLFVAAMRAVEADGLSRADNTSNHLIKLSCVAPGATRIKYRKNPGGTINILDSVSSVYTAPFADSARKCTSDSDCIVIFPKGAPFAVNKQFLSRYERGESKKYYYGEASLKNPGEPCGEPPHPYCDVYISAHNCSKCGVCDNITSNNQSLIFVIESVKSGAGAVRCALYKATCASKKCNLNKTYFEEFSDDGKSRYSVKKNIADKCETEYIEAKGFDQAAASIAAAGGGAPSPALVPPASGGGVSAAE